MMINLLLITSILIFFGLPSVLVLCACIAAARADDRDQRWQQLPARITNTTPYRLSSATPVSGRSFVAQHAADKSAALLTKSASAD